MMPLRRCTEAGHQAGRRRGGAKSAFNFLSAALNFLIRDAMAIVDPELRVHGIAGRRVADAAIMPTVVSGNTNAATIMIGERVADLVREQLRLAAGLFPQGALCKMLQAIVSQQGAKPDDRENCKIRQ